MDSTQNDQGSAETEVDADPAWPEEVPNPDDERRWALVAEDDPFIRNLVASYVEAIGFNVHAAPSGIEAIRFAAETDLDVAIADLDLGMGPNGLQVLAEVRKRQPWLAAVLLTSHRSPEFVTDTQQPLPSHTSYLVKSDMTSRDDLANAIRAAMADRPFLSARESVEVPAISPAQAQLLRLIAQGCSNEEIARQRRCSLRAVESLLSRLYNSLGIGRQVDQNPRVIAAAMYRDGLVAVR